MNKIEKFEKVLTSSFSNDEFVKFIREFLNNIEMVAPTRYNKEYSNFSLYVDGYYHIGNYISDDGDKIAVFSVCLNKGDTVERARGMQRNFVKSLIIRGNCSSAIVAFFTKDEPEKWRLSFIRIDYEFSKGKVTEKLTPARRYSYLVGKGEPCHTAKKRLYTIFLNDNLNPGIDELEEAFSVEKVTKEFFDLYCEKYHQLREYLESNEDFMMEAKIRNFTSEQFAKKLLGQIVFLYFVQKKGWLGVEAIPVWISEKDYKNAFFARGIKSREIVGRIYDQQPDGRYRIIYDELQKLSDEDEEFLAGIVKGKPWGSGPKDFMRRIFDGCISAGKNYFHDYLEPLFYTGLNKNRGENGFYAPLHRRIPFLNGGLFDQIDNYEWENNNFNIPNNIFSDIEEKGRDADGILDIFDRYNFTMNEDEPMEREVAIDPEMLGKVFENLLDVKNRKSKGAFYTPREIVHYMCQETLINHLVNKTGLPEIDIRDFILYGDLMRDEDTTAEVREGHKDMLISTDIFDLNTGVNRLQELDEALANVKVADLAVGSGAFPLGMLNEILKARETLSEYMSIGMNAFEKKSFYAYDRNPYYLKINTIKNCIFACDIEPSAVDIAKLRLWLSIVIDDTISEDGNNGSFDTQTKPRQLPNLDCNIICGNSLIDEFKGIKLIDESELLNNVTEDSQKSMFQKGVDSLLNELIRLQDKLFYTKEHNEKEEIKNGIQNIYNRIILEQIQGNPEIVEEYYEAMNDSSKPFIIWQLYFPRVFRDNGGFDIVIGNPPYVQLQKFRNNPVQEAMKNQNFETYHSKGDIYCLFYEKGIDLLREGGVECLITSNKWIRADYGKPLRNYFLELNPLILIDLGAGIFDTATVDTNIIMIQKARNKGQLRTANYKNKQESLRYVSENDLSQSSFEKNSPWFVGDNNIQNIKAKAEKYGIPLINWDIDLRCGFKTGLNEAFIIDNETKEKLCEKDTNSIKMLRKNLRGKDIRKYTIEWNGLWIIVANYGFYKKVKEFPAIYEHLKQFETKLRNRGQCRYTRGNIINEDFSGQHHWLELDNNPKAEIINMFSSSEKIIFPDISRDSSFYYDTDQFFTQETAFAINGSKLKYLTGMLNSKCVTYIYKTFYAGGGLGESTIRYKKKFLEMLPIPNPNKEDEDIISELVIDIQKAKVLGNSRDVKEKTLIIEKKACKLYNLTDEEIYIIENM